MWFAVALINAGLAKQKNRSRLAWFFISMFFGHSRRYSLWYFRRRSKLRSSNLGVVLHHDDG
jgi:hypothetical protein